MKENRWNPRIIWEKNIKICLTAVRCEAVDSTKQAQNNGTFFWTSIVNKKMN